MGAAHELVLYVRGRPTVQLAGLLALPFDGSDGQIFTHIVGGNDDLPGSGQAGAPEVYALSLRRGSTSACVESLREMFAAHHGPEAILIVTGDYIDGPAEVHRLGYQPHPDPYGVGTPYPSG